MRTTETRWAVRDASQPWCVGQFGPRRHVAASAAAGPAGAGRRPEEYRARQFPATPSINHVTMETKATYDKAASADHATWWALDRLPVAR